ncbi:CatB-related O-acetyltransferase [Thalassorhabdomicrobium marinisediminis]|uniref:Acetyltransferase n=1 Tax=Thalassorhabdomicrobium marinisediminis TaxID=2170577 RepID=A0A2T7FW73_9RHOB|nr:CatB-related O-acetyltransferase [Thalassorhabdomicrobium marinisediminis]PVA06402.1 acetyltransferase [Thalassorhabdomicrobium marinisediminis]
MPPLTTPAFPQPDTRNPVTLPDGSVHDGTVFLKPVIDHPNISVGDYTYASAQEPPDDWAARLAPYLYPGAPERLTLGKFCQIADGVTFITASANHRHDGFSSFPFAIFLDMDRDRPSIPQGVEKYPDTVLGHDVWIGQGATILPGARIGSGCIIGARSVVRGTIPPYTVLAGNPARPLRRRFDEATIDRLLEIAWWDWPIETITAHEAAICNRDLAALDAAAKSVFRQRSADK